MDSFSLMNYALSEYIINTFIQLHICNPNKADRRKPPEGLRNYTNLNYIK